MTPKRYVFLDRDGTIIKDKHYLHDPDQVEFEPGAARGLSRMREMGLGLIMVTNQSGVGRGYYTEDDVALVHARLAEMLSAHGVTFDAVYFCPHDPAEACDCRKPEPGMVRRAAEDFGLDPANCFVIGDKECDLRLAGAVGARPILVRTGKGAACEKDVAGLDFDAADDLDQAATVIQGYLD